MNRKKRTTTRDIAKACFVSQSAVSMILSGRKDIHFAPETIERVKRTAKEMGYEYKARAKRKKTGTNDTIMIMCPSLATQYYTTLIQFITQEAQEHGLCTLTAYTNRSKEREEYYLNMAADTGFYGVIYTYAPRAVTSLNHLHEKVPLVLINDHNPDLKIELLELDSKKSCLAYRCTSFRIRTSGYWLYDYPFILYRSAKTQTFRRNAGRIRKTGL